MGNIQRKKDLPTSQTSVETISTANSESTSMVDYDKLPQWSKNSDARRFCVKSLTAMYALLLTMIGLVIEVSPTWESDDMWVAYNVFSIWMYSTALAFYAYLYFFVINTSIVNSIMNWLSTKVLHRPDNHHIEEADQNGEGAGTLYLRMGVFVFGLVGCTLWAAEIVLCFFKNRQSPVYVIKFVLALQFTIVQTVVIVFYSKVTLKRSNILARFGLMHCVAVNLWTWFSLCISKWLVKKAKKAKKLAESSYTTTRPYQPQVEGSINTDSYFEIYGKQLRTLVKMGESWNIALTFLVEFSLIGAAICFIIWKTESNSGHKKEVQKQKYKFEWRSVNFSKCKQSCIIQLKSTYIGIILGVLVHIGILVTIIFHGVFTREHKKEYADKTVGYADIIMFTIGIFACAFAMFRIRNLQYRLHAHGEVIDEILLIAGLAGEMIYSSIGLDLYLGEIITYGTEKTVVYTAFILRIVQVVIQTLFILLAMGLRTLTQKNIENLPGKQVVTFLLIFNVTLFIYHTYEAMESSFGFPDKIPAAYDGIISICSPIVIFYRFHSSACLAEILKITYGSETHGSSFTRVEKLH